MHDIHCEEFICFKLVLSVWGSWQFHIVLHSYRLGCVARNTNSVWIVSDSIWHCQWIVVYMNNSELCQSVRNFFQITFLLPVLGSLHIPIVCHSITYGRLYLQIHGSENYIYLQIQDLKIICIYRSRITLLVKKHKLRKFWTFCVQKCIFGGFRGGT